MEYDKLIKTLRDNGEADAGKYGINAYDFKHSIESDLHEHIYIKNENYIKLNHPHKIWWNIINSLTCNILLLVISAFIIAWLSANVAILPPHWAMCLIEIMLALTMWYATNMVINLKLGELEKQIVHHHADKNTFIKHLVIYMLVNNISIPVLWSTVLIYRLPIKFQMTCAFINCIIVLLISIITFYKPFQNLYNTYVSKKD